MLGRRMYIAGLAAGALVLIAGCSSSGTATEGAATTAPSEVAATAAASAAASDEAETGGTVVVGHLQNLTGPSGSYGKSVECGVNIAVSEVNAAGGVNGNQIEVITEDTASSNEQTAALVPKLAATDAVLIMAPIYTANFLAGQAAANEAKIPYLTQGSGISANAAGEISAEGGFPGAAPYSFNLGLPYSQMIRSTLETLPVIGAKKAAIIMQPDNPAQVLTTKISEGVLGDLGVDVVAKVEVASKTADYSAQITQIVKGNPDVVLVNMTRDDGAQFMRQARSRGLEARWVSPNNGLLSAALYEESGGAADGLIVPNQVPLDASIYNEFVKKVTEQCGPDIQSGLASYGYDGMQRAAAAIAASGTTTDRELVRKALGADASYVGVNGNYVNDGESRYFLEAAFPVVLTKDGFVPFEG